MGVAGTFPTDKARTSVRAIVALIAALFVLFLGVLIFSTYQARNEAQRNAEQRAEAASQVMATNTRWVVELAHQALRRIDEVLGDDLTTGQHRSVQDIRDAIDNMPASGKAYVVDANGDTLYSTDPMVQPINITDREYFSVPAAGAQWYTSSLMVSRLNGEQIFAFSKRLERNGKFAGVAVISFSVTMLSEIWASLGFDKESTVSIIRDDGMLVGRYPLADGPLDLSNYILFTQYLKESSSGVYSAISPADRVQRFVSYRKVPDSDLIALSSVSASAAYALFWNKTLWLFGLSVPTAIALAGASIWIVRLIQDGARRQEALTQALEINRLLFRDTHHRVKNNLQSVQSLVRMQNIPPESKMDLQGRIAAMTAVHEHIYRLDQYAEIETHELIPAIVEPLKQTFDKDIEVDYDIDHVFVDRDYATPLALLVNEVVTNAMKYAFPEHGAGKIGIALKMNGEIARLTIADNGIGFDPEKSASGMGNKLIRGMVTQLEGDFSYGHGGGTAFTANIRLNAKVPVPLRQF